MIANFAWVPNVRSICASRQAEEIVACILQDRSPSCGVGRIYDGTFSGTLTPGNGVFVDLLLRHGYRVIPASEFDPSMLE